MRDSPFSIVVEHVRNNEYDPFARLYNRHWGADYHAAAFPLVQRLLLSGLKPGAAILDVCCGNGRFTQQICKQGFRVSGIDASQKMIAYAKENAPDAELTVADVRDFSLGRKFDAAYSVFESLNHVPDIDGLEHAFRSIKKHLKRGAPFLFDLNQEDAFRVYWNTTDAVVGDEEACILRMDYDDETRKATCKVTSFEKDAEWRRTDFTLHQTCHDTEQVQHALKRAGFKHISLYDAGDAGMKGDAAYARLFFLAT